MTFILHRNVYLHDKHYQWQFTDNDGELLMATNSLESATMVAYEIVSYGHVLVDEEGRTVNHV